MSMIRQSTLREWRKVVNKMDYHASRDRERQLMDSHIEAHEIIDTYRTQVGELVAENHELRKRLEVPDDQPH